MPSNSFGDQRPRLLDCRIHSTGSKLVIENHVNGGEFTLPLDQRGLVESLNGERTIKEIVSSLYSKGERIGFRALFTTLQTLHDQGLLAGFQPASKKHVTDEDTFFDLEHVHVFRTLKKVTLAKHLTVSKVSPGLFFLFTTMLFAVAAFSPVGLLKFKSMENFLKIQGGYALALPALFLAVSAMASLKTILKTVLVALATGHVYQLQLKIKWFAIYIDVSDHGIFHSDKKGVIAAYQLASAMSYFFIAVVIGFVFRYKSLQGTLNTLAFIMTLADTHPYHRSDLTKLFATIFGERPLRHMIPYLKSRSILGILLSRNKIANESSYVLYSSVALVWVFVAMIFSMKILSQNIPLLTAGWQYASYPDFVTRTIVLFGLALMVVYSLSDILTTLVRNFLEPALTPLMKVMQKLKSRPIPARERPELAEVLNQVVVFDDVSPLTRSYLIEHSVIKKFSPGTNLIIQGTDAGELFILCKGSVDVIRREPSGLKTQIATLVAPAVFGEIGIISDVSRTADIVSRDEVEVLVINRDVFTTLMKQESFELDRARLLKKFTLSHYISSSPLFSQIPAEAAHLFSLRGKTETHDAGKVIIKEGEVSKSFYLLLEGRVEVVRGESLVAELKQGDFFGEIALIADLPRTASVWAKDETTILRLDQDDFWEILSSHVEIAMSLESVAESRLEEIKCSAA